MSTGRRTRTWLLLISIILTQYAFMELAFSSEVISIFDMHKSLPMDPGEPAYHDYYINAGPEAGLKKGMFVAVYRSVPVHDPIQNKAQADLHIEVARIQIVHVEKNISVGRLVAELGNDDRPTLEYESIMMGDRIDLATATMELPKLKKKAVKAVTADKDTKANSEVLATAENASEAHPEAPAAVEKSQAQPEKTSASTGQTDMVQVPIPKPGAGESTKGTAKN